MKNRPLVIILSMIIAFFLVSTLSYSQEKPVRFLKQHKSAIVKDQLETTEGMIGKALGNDSTDMKISAVQTIRELEEIFPTEPFNSFIEPLCSIIRDEKSGTHLRILSALALDELHSDLGDKAIFEVSKNAADESVKNVCIALATESTKLSDKLDQK
jgi:hypothetical protein